MSTTTDIRSDAPEASLVPGLGPRMKILREDHGFTRGDVSRALGVSRRTVRQWERSQEPVPLESRLGFAQMIGVHPDALVPSRDESRVGVREGMLFVGGVSRPVGVDADDATILSTYADLVAQLRGLPKGAPIPLRDDDLDALAGALGGDPDLIESELIRLMGVSAEEAARLRKLILRKRLAVPAAGLAMSAAAVIPFNLGQADTTESADAGGNTTSSHVVVEEVDGGLGGLVDPSDTGTSWASKPNPPSESTPMGIAETGVELGAPTLTPDISAGSPLVVERPDDPDTEEGPDVAPELGEAISVERLPDPTTTVPDTTVPDTTVPDTTVPDTTVPEADLGDVPQP